ncbi:MAG TPA: PKD domain-containing protein [Solirubrobacteraceae bacterium]
MRAASRLTLPRVTGAFVAALLSIALLLALGANQSLAAGGWLPSQPAGSFSEGDFPDSEALAPAINQVGAEAVGWTTGTSGDAVVAIRRPGAADFKQQTIDPGSASETSAHLRLAIDQAGDVLAVWQEYHVAEGMYSVDYALIAADGVTTGLAEVPGTLEKGYEEVSVQYLPNGQGLISWHVSGDNSIEYLPLMGATLGTTLAISTNAEPEAWAFEESGSGLRAAWSEEIKEGTTRVISKIEAESIAGNGALSTAQNVDETSTTCPPVNEQCDIFSLGFQFYAHDAGETLTWMTSANVRESGHGYEGVSFNLKAADATPGAPFGAPQTVIENKDEQYMHWEVAALAGGGLLACWDEEVVHVAGTILCSARGAGATSWTAPQIVATSSETTTIDEPKIVPAGEGAYVLYAGRSTPALAQRVSAAGAPESAPFQLSGEDSHEATPPIAANDGAGDGLAVWMPEHGGETIVDTASYDAGPRLTGFSVPASLAEAALGTFGVAATDPLSPIASIGWSFGDGGSAQGASVTHAYGSPGTQTATVTVTDAAGLSSSLSGTTTVPTPAVAHPRLRATLHVITKRLRALLKSGLKLEVGCSQACKLTVELQVSGKLAKTLGLGAHAHAAAKRPGRKHGAAHRKQLPVVLAHRSLKLKAAGSRKLDVKLAKKLRKRLAKVHRLKLTVVVQASGSGQHAKASKTLTLH